MGKRITFPECVAANRDDPPQEVINKFNELDHALRAGNADTAAKILAVLSKAQWIYGDEAAPYQEAIHRIREGRAPDHAPSYWTCTMWDSPYKQRKIK